MKQHCHSPAGALAAVLLCDVVESDLLLSNLSQPLVVLASYVQRILDSELLLAELVRQADVEWGRTYGERPHFQKEGSPPDQEDPYTLASTRATLTRLIDALAVENSA